MAKQKLEDVLENFQNGEARYQQDATFKHAIDALVSGVGVYAVLDATLRDFARFRAVTERQTTETLTQLDLLIEKLSHKNQ